MCGAGSKLGEKSMCFIFEAIEHREPMILWSGNWPKPSNIKVRANCVTCRHATPVFMVTKQQPNNFRSHQSSHFINVEKVSESTLDESTTLSAGWPTLTPCRESRAASSCMSRCAAAAGRIDNAKLYTTERYWKHWETLIEVWENCRKMNDVKEEKISEKHIRKIGTYQYIVRKKLEKFEVRK